MVRWTLELRVLQRSHCSEHKSKQGYQVIARFLTGWEVGTLTSCFCPGQQHVQTSSSQANRLSDSDGLQLLHKTCNSQTPLLLSNLTWSYKLRCSKSTLRVVRSRSLSTPSWST